MRKGQLKILAAAKRNGYPKALMELLSQEDLTLKELRALDYKIWSVREYDVSCEWIKLFCSIEDDMCRHIAKSYIETTGDLSVDGLKQFVSEETAIKAFSSKGVKCEDLLDVYFVICYGQKSYIKELMSYQRQVRAFDFDKNKKDYFWPHSFCDFVENLVGFADKISDATKFISGLDVDSPVTIDTDWHVIIDKYLTTNCFSLHDSNMIPEDIKNIDFHGYHAELKVEGYGRRVDICDKFMSATIGQFNKIFVNSSGGISTGSWYKKRKFIFSFDTFDFIYGYFKKDNSIGYTPMKLKDFFDIINVGYSERDKSDAQSVVDFLCRKYDTYLFKDLWRDYCESGRLLLPILISEAGRYKNKQDMFRNFYGLEMNGNWNIRNANLVYAMMKLLPYMTQEAIARVLQKKKTVYMCHIGRQRYKLLYILYSAVYDVQLLDNPLLCDALRDEYNDKHIRLDNINQTINRHNIRYYDESQYQTAGKFVIRSNTKFKKLIDNMPDEFELIRTPKRLTEEGKRQHNCVAQYSDRIDNDGCMIYSTVYNNNRHTIEIAFSKNKYVIRQCLKACNVCADSGLHSKLREIIAKINDMKG